MELDELKQTWQRLDAQLQRHDALAFEGWKDRRVDRARVGLRPLFWGQLVQMLFGMAVLLAGVSLWTSGRDVPVLLAAGLVLHVYGIAVVIVSGVTLGFMRRIDYGAPVVAIQKQLAHLRRCYVIGGMVVGLPWWVLWMLPPAVVAGLRGGDATWLWIAAAVSIAGLLGTWWFHRWVRRPGREALARRMDDSLTGGSLRKAQAALDEVRAFERE